MYEGNECYMSLRWECQIQVTKISPTLSCLATSPLDSNESSSTSGQGRGQERQEEEEEVIPRLTSDDDDKFLRQYPFILSVTNDTRLQQRILDQGQVSVQGLGATVGFRGGGGSVSLAQQDHQGGDKLVVGSRQGLAIGRRLCVEGVEQDKDDVRG